ncbi:amidohydrolase family protein [Nocardia takedensis]|uniref:amidohydrolase family protein n=1 Tax=Nocardia takedensis TaxID=259390 RepID=UPI0002FEEDEC|nr:amidohydrolase family protein [Nocardia takedensis]
MSVRVLHADQVLTGSGAALRSGSVVVDGAHIAWVGPTDHLPSDWRHPEIEQIPLPDATLLPGLVDAHVHLAFEATAPAETPPTGQAAAPSAEDRAIAAARQLVRAGVTTVRDLGAPGHLDLTSPAASGLPWPRVLAAGIPLTVPGGHCAAFGGAVTTTADIERVIAANAARGARWIKVMVTGGFTTSAGASPYTAQFTDAQLAAIVATAAEHGLPVAAHAHATVGIAAAVRAGVDSLEHCTWMSAEGFDLDHGLIAEIADRRIPVCPSINHLARAASGRLPWPVRRHQLQTMLDAGVQLIPGTDSGIPHTPHGCYPSSLAAYTDLGLTPGETIDMATRRNAYALGIGHRTGSLAAGMVADLLAVPGDPTRDLDLLDTPVLVAAAGELHHPDSTAEEHHS